LTTGRDFEGDSCPWQRNKECELRAILEASAILKRIRIFGQQDSSFTPRDLEPKI
jgi:hypothetical protein